MNEVEVALEVGGVGNADDAVGGGGVGAAAEEDVAGDGLVGRAGGERISAGQVNEREGLAVLGVGGADLALDRDAGVVANLLLQASEGVEEGGFAAVWIAYEGVNRGAGGFCGGSVNGCGGHENGGREARRRGELDGTDYHRQLRGCGWAGGSEGTVEGARGRLAAGFDETVGAAGELGALRGVLHEFDAVAVGVAEPGLEGIIEAAANLPDLDATGEEDGASGGEVGDLEGEVVVAVARNEGCDGRGGVAPLKVRAALVEELHEGGVAEGNVGPENGAVGGGEAEFNRKAQGVAVKGDKAIEVVGVQAEVGEAQDHAANAHHPRVKVKGKQVGFE